jgi:Zn-dependent protease/predicted transcriptional regulator
MKWSIPLGRWFGIPVYLHFTFLLVLGFLALAQGLASGSVSVAVQGAGFFAAIFVCVLLHEFGHALMARRYGVGTRDIVLLPIGGVARLDRLPSRPEQELWIALAGPAVNVVIAVALGLWLSLSGGADRLLGLAASEGGFAARLLTVNIFLVLFNLLPAFPMDGGRVLRALLAMKLDYALATRIAGRTGQGMALLFAGVGLFWNPMLLLIALFVWFGAAQEMHAANTRSTLAGVTARQAMLTDFTSLTSQERLGEVARLVLSGSQPDYPVVEAGTVVGLLERRQLLDGLSRLGPDAPVSEVMCRQFPLIEADDLVESLLSRSPHAEFSMLPVVSNGRLVGLFTLENLTEWMMVKTAIQRERAGGDAALAADWHALLQRT